MATDVVEYAIGRLLSAIPVVVLVSIIVFGLVRLVPGGPVVVMLGPDATQAQIEATRRAMGLDQPVWRQYLEYVWGLLRLDFGQSYVTNQGVSAAIAQRLPTTIAVALAGFVVALAVAIPAATISVLGESKLADYGALVFGLLGLSIPNFWLGIFLLLVFAVGLDLFPVAGYVSPLDRPVESVRYLVLPGVTLGTSMAAIVTRMLRSEMLEELDRDYPVALRMKGVSSRTRVRHVLKNAFIPVVTVIGMQFGYLLGGTIVIETVFSIPGMGRLLLTAINNRDYVMIQGIVISLVGFFVVVNMLVDVAYFYLNPKLRDT